MEKKEYIVALDLGCSGVKLALGSVVDEWLTVEDVVYEKMTADGMSRGEITNRQAVSTAIRNAVEKLERANGIRISDVHTCVSDKHIKCATHDYFVFVSRSDGEIRKEDVNKLHDGMNNVQAEDGVRILERIPQIYRVHNAGGVDAVLNPVGRFGKKLASTFTFVFGSNPMIERYERTLSELQPSLTPASLSAGPMMAIEATASEEEREMGVAIVDLGRDTTNLCICKDGIIRYVRTIPIGSGDINNDIREYGVPASRVEAIKRTHGEALADRITEELAIKASSNAKRPLHITSKILAAIIESRLKDITNFISLEIGDSGYKGKLHAGVVLTGGGANLRNIDLMMERELGMDVRIANPDMHVTPAEGKEELLEMPEFATVIGMLHSAKNRGMYNHVEVIRTIGTPSASTRTESPRTVATPEVKPAKTETTFTPEVERAQEPAAPKVTKPTTVVAPTPVVEKAVETPATEETQSEEPKIKNPWLERIKDRTAELMNSDKAEEAKSESTEESATDSFAGEERAEQESKSEPKKRGWFKRLVDTIFPVDVEGDEYDE